jgi:hypothetical protein
LPACQLLESPQISTQEVGQRLSHFREPLSFEGVPNEYIDRVINVEQKERDPNSLKFTFIHHELRIFSLGDDGGEQRIVIPLRVMVLITPRRRKTIWFVYGQRKDANAVARFFGLKLFSDVDAILNIAIPPSVLADLEQHDSIDVRAAKFRDVDSHVKEAGLRGSLTRSKRLRDLKQDGTWADITFASMSTGRRVRVTIWGLVSMMGRGVTREDLEAYIVAEILPRAHR